jgi:hypothetical protein
MDSSITLKMHELFAVSSDVSLFINDQTRKHRLPVEPKSNTAATSVNANAESPYDVNVSVMSTQHLYACPSSHAKAILDRDLTYWGLIDHGSEVNLIPRRVYERLDNVPIDTDIQ